MDCASHAVLLKGVERGKGTQEKWEFKVYVQEAYLKANGVAREISHRSNKGVKARRIRGGLHPFPWCRRGDNEVVGK